jgi:hypothetical protein
MKMGNTRGKDLPSGEVPPAGLPARWLHRRTIEVAACALAVEHNMVPPTANWATRDPDCDLDYVPATARDQRVDVALSVGSGFGGFQSAIVLVRP